MTPSDFPTEFAALLPPLLPRLRRVAAVAARRREDADALVQTALERAQQQCQAWPAGSRLDVRLFGLLADALADSRKTAPATDTTEARQQAAPVPPIEQALASLPEHQRLVVALVLVDGLRYADAAAALGMPVAELRAQLAQARSSLHELLSGHARTVP